MTPTTAVPDQTVVTGRTSDRGDKVVFIDNGSVQVTVSRTSGDAVLHVSTNGSAPSTRGPWRWTLPADQASLTVPVPVPGAAVVRLHAADPVDWAVQAL